MVKSMNDDIEEQKQEIGWIPRKWITKEQAKEMFSDKQNFDTNVSITDENKQQCIEVWNERMCK